MNERITNIQAQDFLNDFEQYSETIILEEGKEKNEILAIAKNNRIDLRNNRDLAGFKTIYTFANKANKNRARLPKGALLKALPSMISKPIDIDHKRQYVVGHYIDYRYKQKEDMVIAYGVFYKSNFGKEWERAKKLFKAKKLATSYEIWCPDDQRKDLPDGTYELLQQEIAGGALLFKAPPAFEDAKVLELAMQNTEKYEQDLVFAKYKEEELILSENFNCECIKCGYRISSEKHCKDLKCPKCEGTMRRIERPGTGQPSQSNQIKCSNCGEEFEKGVLGETKCPKCFAILNSNGQMIYPPQMIDFKVLCPSCKVNRWRLLSKSDEEAKLRCLNCAKEYTVTFAKSKLSEDIDKLDFVYIGTVTCYQCNKAIEFSGVSSVKTRNFTCPRCGLQFSHDITRTSQKKISKIVEIEQEKMNAGGQNMKVEMSKYHRYIEDADKFEKTLDIEYADDFELSARLTTEQRNALPDNMFAIVVRVKDKRTGKMRKIRKYPINDKAHVRNALARLGQTPAQETLRRLGVSIDKVRAKILRRARQLGMTDLLERYKKSSEKGGKKMADKKKVDKASEEKVEAQEQKIEKKEEAKAEEKVEQQPEAEAKPKAEDKKAEEPSEAKAEEAPKAEENKVEEKAQEKVEEPKKAEEKAETKPAEEPKVEGKKEEAKVEEKPKEEKVEEPKETKEQKYAKGIRKLASMVRELRKSMIEKIAFYKANAEEINKRRTDLGDYSNDLSDVDILNDEKFAKAKAKKENAKIEKSAVDVVGKKEKDEDFYTQKRNEINDLAFPKN